MAEAPAPVLRAFYVHHFFGGNFGTSTTPASNPPAVLTPSSATFAGIGGSAMVAVTFPAGCPWTATSNAPWIHITSGGSGTVTYSVASNTSDARVGTITIADQIFLVTQAGGCAFLIDPVSRAFTVAGGNGSFNLMTTSGWAWTATSGDNWIVITPPAAGPGSATIQFQVAANSGERFRVGTITVGGTSFSVEQEGTAAGTCNNIISPTFASFSSGGGRGPA